MKKIFTRFFNNPIKIEIAAHGTPLEKIIQKAYHVPNFATKINLLEHLLKTDNEMKKVLVFASTIKQADRLFEQMNKKYDPNWDLSGVIENVQVLHAIGKRLVGESTFPQWNADSEFRAAREAMLKAATAQKH